MNVRKNKKIVFLANKDNVLYNFRKECILNIKNAGYEVILICPYGKKIDYFLERDCKYIDIQFDRRGTNFYADIKLILKYIKLFIKIRPDLVCTYTSKCSIYGGIVCRMLKIPYIVNNAGLMGIPKDKKWLSIVMKMLHQVGYAGASCMMYQNIEEKAVLNKEIGKRVHYRMLPGSGVNLDEFEYSPLPKTDKIVFNYVARIMKEKGIDEFLECAKKIKKKYSNTEFVIYGDYDDMSYKKVIEDYEKRNIVRYGGIQMDMKPCILSAYAVIHPSWYEGMTNVCLEHSAMGRICIGSDIHGIKEIIDENKTGFLFGLHDVNMLIYKVEKFINLSYEQKAEMGINARKKVENEFDRNIVNQIYLEEIDNILGVK